MGVVRSFELKMEEKKSKISYFSANITPIISVSLVLLLLGIVAMLGIAANSLTDYVKENIGFDVVMKNDASQQEIDALKQMWTKAPYVASVKYISKEDALQSWEKETGENLMEVIGVNPLSSEFEVRVKPQYVSVDSLNRIEYALSQNKSIDSVKMHKDVVEKINSNVNSVVLVLGAVLVLLVIISFVLINNTVRLAVYSRRFIIYTMKLVGATKWYIMRPFLRSALWQGVLSGVVAGVMVLGVFYGINYIMPSDVELLSEMAVVIIIGGLVLLGVLITVIFSAVAVNKFVNMKTNKIHLY